MPEAGARPALSVATCRPRDRLRTLPRAGTDSGAARGPKRRAADNAGRYRAKRPKGAQRTARAPRRAGCGQSLL